MAYYHEENAAERLLGKELARRGLDFRQSEIIAGREIDFFLPRFLLAIEVDGFSHLAAKVRVRDRTKERALTDLGITLLRLGNQEVLGDVRACGDRINLYLRTWERNVRRAGAPGEETPFQRGLRDWAARSGLNLPGQSDEPPGRRRG